MYRKLDEMGCIQKGQYCPYVRACDMAAQCMRGYNAIVYETDGPVLCLAALAFDGAGTPGAIRKGLPGGPVGAGGLGCPTRATAPASPKLTYKDILTFKKFVGTICAAISMADQVGYRYIMWNDRVYEIVDRAAVDTGLTLDDIESTAIHR